MRNDETAISRTISIRGVFIARISLFFFFLSLPVITGRRYARFVTAISPGDGDGGEGNRREKGADRINNADAMLRQRRSEMRPAICALLRQRRPLYYALNPVLRLQRAVRDEARIKYKI